ncbi:MAG: hypothetical protein Q4B32_02235 [Clostridia bacterium]|nr:hypothetical protein [Clostridia bacterium]
MPDSGKSVRLGKFVPQGERSLAQVAEDLWGTTTVVPSTHGAENTAVPKATEVPAFPSFDQLWKTADETVDWTDALVNAQCPDGMTSPQLWAFFHEHAQAVLAGDTEAYLQVMDRADPLGDLQPFARSIEATADSSDLLSASFQVLPSYLEGTEETRQRYLCGMSLRIARDLLALLPVSAVQVKAMQEKDLLLSVTFPRSELQKVHFSFIDPIAFVHGLQHTEA